MELTVEALSFQPSSGNWADCAESLEEWNEAYRRVESYFSALRVENKLLLSSLVFKILGIASERLGKEPGRLPVELAAEETDRLLVSWFCASSSGPRWNRSTAFRLGGAAALLLVDTKVP